MDIDKNLILIYSFISILIYEYSASLLIRSFLQHFLRWCRKHADRILKRSLIIDNGLQCF